MAVKFSRSYRARTLRAPREAYASRGTQGPPNLAEVFGAGNRTRTGDFDLGKVALYQLSYSRITIV